MALEIDFQTDSAFSRQSDCLSVTWIALILSSVRKELTIISSFYSTVVPRYYGPEYLKYIDLMFKNVQVSFEQAQQQISTILLILLHFDASPTLLFIICCLIST